MGTRHGSILLNISIPYHPSMFCAFLNIRKLNDDEGISTNFDYRRIFGQQSCSLLEVVSSVWAVRPDPNVMHAKRHLASFKLSIMGSQMSWMRYFLINLVFIGYGTIAKTITSSAQEDLPERVSTDVWGWLKLKVNLKGSERHGIFSFIKKRRNIS